MNQLTLSFLFTCRSLAENPETQLKKAQFPRTQDEFIKALNDPGRAEHYRQVVKSSGGKLKESFMQMSQSLEGFFHLRRNFVASHSLVSIISWLMTIGDR